MLSFLFVRWCVLIAIILEYYAATQGAPTTTHHLTIGVQGNTPTLMVTSSEIGIKENTKRDHERKSIKAIKEEAAKFPEIRAEKTKLSKTKENKKMLKFNKEPRITNATISRDIQLYKAGKKTAFINIMKSHRGATPSQIKEFEISRSIDIGTSTGNTTMTALFTPKPFPRNSTVTLATFVNAHQLQQFLSGKQLMDKSIIDNKANIRKYAPQTQKKAVLLRSSATASTLISLTEATSNLPIERQRIEFDGEESKPTMKTPPTHASNTKVSAPNEDQIVEKLNENETTTMQASLGSHNHAAYNISFTKIPPALTLKQNDKLIASHKQKPSNNIEIQQESIKEIILFRTNGESNTTKKHELRANSIIGVQCTATPKLPLTPFVSIKTEEMQMKSNATDVNTTLRGGLSAVTTAETIIKLIDLEKHDFKAIENLNHSADEYHYSDGHDGVKVTKKKQLIDKHFLEIIDIDDALEKPNTNSTSKNITKLVRNDNETISTTTGSPNNLVKRYNYLGPIITAEKIFHGPPKNDTNEKTLYKAAIENRRNKGHIAGIKATVKFLPTSAGLPLTTTFANTTPIKHETLFSTVLSTTVFQVPEMVAVTRTPVEPDNVVLTSKGTPAELEKKTESKISDIQIEVYDSTIDSIVASTNFKDFEASPSSNSTSARETTRLPSSSIQQERFTQYVIDRSETSTPQSINLTAVRVVSGRPEPAAIEIHINVSESFGGNDSEDLDFSFTHNDYAVNENDKPENYYDGKGSNDINVRLPTNLATGQTESPDGTRNKGDNDEILVVEIVDTLSKAKLKSIRSNDELFTPKMGDNFATPPPPPPPPPYQPSFDRDSDTIFYISNTEVKVGESLPTGKTPYEQQQERKTKLENQFFPVNYMASTHPNIHNGEEETFQPHHLYEEDIILSPRRNQADSLKIYRNQNEAAPPLDVTYVGESIIEVEQSPDITATTILVPEHSLTQRPDIIIQPEILPEISIGVPVIGELPPQIELKEIDFMPNEAQVHRSGVYENENSININYVDENAMNTNGNDEDRLVESSIQYGGDLIDESADGGFDGVEGSYPFGNPAAIRNNKPNHAADYAHFSVNYGVNNMRKDELMADVGGYEQNETLKELLSKTGVNNTSFNVTYSVAAERLSNATAFSSLNIDSNDLLDEDAEMVNFVSLVIGFFIIILPLVVSVSMFCALRYLYSKYQSNSADNGVNPEAKNSPGKHAYDDGVERDESSTVPSHASQESERQDILSKSQPLSNDNLENINQVNTSTHLESSNRVLTINSSKSNDGLLSLSVVSLIKSTQGDKCGPNGSITKMTLENNLLIVETEERNDISRVARETKMDYNKHGVFVVEVARGIDSKCIPESPIAESSERMLAAFDNKQNGDIGYKVMKDKITHNNERVQIHSPPPDNEELSRNLHQIEEVDEPVHSPQQESVENDLTQANTGLSQSDLSITSSNDSNKAYNYGNQALYVIENDDYTLVSPVKNVANHNLKDDDHNSENGHNEEQNLGQNKELKIEAAKKDIIKCHLVNSSEVTDKQRKEKEEGITKQTISKNTKPIENLEHKQMIEHKTISINSDDVNEKCEENDEGKYNQLKIKEKDANGIVMKKEYVQGLPQPTDEEINLVNNDETQIKKEVSKISSNSLGHPALLNNSIEEDNIPLNASDLLPDLIPDNSLIEMNGSEEQTEIVNENGYDSIITLPEPPNNDGALGNDASLLDTIQLDSLPPPPSPLPLTNESEIEMETANIDELVPAVEMHTNELKELHKPGEEKSMNNVYSVIPPPRPPASVTLDLPSNGKLVNSPLTPPASPPLHYSNGLARGGLCAHIPITVDVNGS
uniref:Uncharacterized protein n=1 Tax=Glossina pallidipes TaxID=7398 RepID=A0A1A9Z248_GLOPL